MIGTTANATVLAPRSLEARYEGLWRLALRRIVRHLFPSLDGAPGERVSTRDYLIYPGF